jgi:hypothetical protein
MSLERVKLGKPLGKFPGRTWNTLVRQVGAGGTSAQKLPRPGGGGGGSTTRRAIMYDDLPGYERDGVTITPGKVRCLPLIRVGETGWAVDLNAEVIQAEPGYGAKITNVSASCCGGTPGAPSLVISHPITTDNLVLEAEKTDITISGTGADPSSTVNVTFFPIVTGQPFEATIDLDGTWETEAIDLSSATSGSPRDVVMTVIARETDASGFAHKPAELYFTRGQGRVVGDASSYVTTPPSPPDLLSASDTGLSSVDNRTANTTPTFRVQNTVSHDKTGPLPRLYANGVEVAAGTVDSFADTDVVELTTTPLAEGIYEITYTLVTYSPGTTIATRYESGHSPALRLIVSSEGASTTGSITATSSASADITVEDPDIAVESVAIENDTDPQEPNPSPPVSVPQPRPPVALEQGDPVPLSWNGAAWQIRQPGVWARECVLQTIDKVETIISVGPCPLQWTSAEKLKLDGVL